MRAKPPITIVVPSHRTPDLTKLCLRLLRKNVDPALAKVLVVDNDSKDESVDWLRSLGWIDLLERDISNDGTPSESHARALDLAARSITTPLLLSIHTDTMIRDGELLDVLLAELEAAPEIAGAGSWKLEHKPLFRRMLKRVEYRFQQSFHALTGKTDHRLEGHGKNSYYLRSHCALYRVAPILEYDLSFVDNDFSTGRKLHEALLEKGHRMRFLPSERIREFADHFNHATMIYHPELGARARSVRKGKKVIAAGFRELGAEQILADDSLDQ